MHNITVDRMSPNDDGLKAICEYCLQFTESKPIEQRDDEDAFVEIDLLSQCCNAPVLLVPEDEIDDYASEDFGLTDPQSLDTREYAIYQAIQNERNQ